MLTQLVNAATTPQQLEAIQSLLADHVDVDEALNLSLSHKYLEFGDFTHAEQAAARALLISPQSPQAHFAAALPAHQAAVNGDRSQRKRHLADALEHYDAAETGAKVQNFPLLRPEILINRATIKLLLGEPVAAGDDYRAAVAAASRPAPYAATAVNFFLSQAEYGTAWDLLEFIDKNAIEGRFLTAVTEYHNTQDQAARKEYLAEMLALASEAWPRALECRFHCLDWALTLKAWDVARDCFPDHIVHTHPLQGNTARAWIAYEENNLQSANEYVDKARPCRRVYAVL